MRARTVFGIGLLLIGLLAFASNFNFMPVNWLFLSHLWPVILILIGLAILGRGSIVLAGFFWLVLLAGIASAIYFSTVQTPPAWVPGSTVTTNHLVIDDTAPPSAKFRLHSGAGTFSFEPPSGSNLIEADTVSSFGDYKINKSGSSYTLEPTRENGRTWFGPLKNEATVRLSAEPAWDVTVDSGAATLNLDLSQNNLSNLTVKAGASTVNATFGDKSASLDANFSLGAATATIKVPRDIGVSAEFSGGLSSRSLPEFEMTDKDHFVTSNYGSASQRIRLKFEAGASTVTILRVD